MVLGFQARQSTRNVDAIFAPVDIVRQAAVEVANELDLPPDWLNDAAKGFVSPHAEFRDLSDIELPNLRIQIPTAEYLLGMKVMAARTGLGEGHGDKDDIRYLIQRLGLRDAGTVMNLGACYYDPAQVLAEEFPL